MANKETKQAKQKLKAAGAKIENVKYYTFKASCACGAEYEVGSTEESIRVDICGSCHPFFTGENKIMDTEGRIEKFRKKYNLKSK